jgi:hypothetical protein
MSLVIRSIAVEGFRKFREPIKIDGLADGLNIIIEPNETGKSTLLDALRAAFFVRHNTKNQLAQSFAPHGEAIGPEVEVAFDVAGSSWKVGKRFLKNPSIEVIGPQTKAQGEDAEIRLNTLLGSVRDTSRNGDVSTYGALGLLWVAQTEALSVTAPSPIVRDTVTAILEAEVGSIMGGDAYRRVKNRIEAQYQIYWTPTGQKRGPQIQARERAELTEQASVDADERLASLERSFAELEAVRARLKIIHREIADQTDVQTRTGLVASLDTARAAAQILATRRAEHEAVNGKVKSLEYLQHRHQDATDARKKADTALDLARAQRTGHKETLERAKLSMVEARAALELARANRQSARAALTVGEERTRQARRQAAVRAARDRHGELLALEHQYRNAKAIAATTIAPKFIKSLEGHDRAVAEARAIVNAGAIRIELSGTATGITLDGEPMLIGARTLTREARIRLGDAEILISPPTAAASADEVLASALQHRQAALDELQVTDLAEARARIESARDAAADMRTLEARIGAISPADDMIELAAGPEALKLLVASLDEDADEEHGDLPDIAALKAAMDSAETALARADGVQDSAIEALRRAELDDAPLVSIEAAAASDLANAISTIEAIEGRPEWTSLSGDLAEAREYAATAAVNLEEALRNASALDVDAIARKIAIIDARIKTTVSTRIKLETDIARLEGTIESEGGVGLADRAAAAREEADAARAALLRTLEEADTLKLLRDTLEASRNETSAQFVGPVAKRAKRHIERLLPGSDLIFSQDLALESVIRGGANESCVNLSRGTQEQLAVLTRIAFADILLEQGKPVSLILDDPLVYSDDARLDLMTEILTDAATRMQVILLTCRDRAFRHVPGHRITLMPIA